LIELGARPVRVTDVAGLLSFPVEIAATLRRFGSSLLRATVGATVLWFVWRLVGAAPFRDGVRAVTWQGVVAAVTLTALTTLWSAWRWRVVARALGSDLPLAAAFGAYYRSLFLNSVLFGGGLGDVRRAVVHGRRAGDVVRGLRAVAWERLCGQVIQAAVTAVVLLALPSPVRPALPYILAGLAAMAACAALAVHCAARSRRSRLTGAARAISTDLRQGLLAPHVWPQILVASVLVVAGHTATFVVAARVAGSTAPLVELVALLLVVQCAMVVPLSVGGWGLREGAAAWAFGVAGLGAPTGVRVATLYALLMLAAVAPGAGLLVADSVRRLRDHSLPRAVRPPAVRLRHGIPRRFAPDHCQSLLVDRKRPLASCRAATVQDLTQPQSDPQKAADDNQHREPHHNPQQRPWGVGVLM
jgi:uncharacterized membrane protein YbhN (UPF0104 family)